MRDIKMKLWHRFLEAWIPDGFSIDCKGIYVTTGRDRIYKVGEEVDVVFYTGLKDTDGVEIYEGDILKGFKKEQNDKSGEHGYEVKEPVVYRHGGFVVFSQNMQEGYTRDNNILYQFMWCVSGSLNGSDHYYQIDEIEVTGNVYESAKQLIK